MISFQLPTDRVHNLQLAFHKEGAGLVASWRSSHSSCTIVSWDNLEQNPDWQLSDILLYLSPDGEWVSLFDKEIGEVRITRVGQSEPTAVIERDKSARNVWTAVAPDGVALAWKEEPHTVVRSLPDGEVIAQVRTGFGVDLRFSPGGRWLTEKGKRVFRVFDRSDDYRVIARIQTPRFKLAEVSDGLTAVVTTSDSTVSIWDLSSNTSTTSLQVGSVSTLAITADGERVLTGSTDALECGRISDSTA